MSCPWCIAKQSYNNSNLKEYDFDLPIMKKFLQHPLLKQCLFVFMTGGEPLLNDSIFDIIRYVRDKGKFISMVTNGVLLGG